MGRVPHLQLGGPMVLKEIFIGIALGFAAGFVWKRQQWKGQQKVRAFYDMYDKGEISLVRDEE